MKATLFRKPDGQGGKETTLILFYAVGWYAIEAEKDVYLYQLNRPLALGAACCS